LYDGWKRCIFFLFYDLFFFKLIFDFSYCLRVTVINRFGWISIYDRFYSFLPVSGTFFNLRPHVLTFFKRILLSVKTYCAFLISTTCRAVILKYHTRHWLKTNVIKINKCIGIKINWKYKLPPIFSSLYADFFSFRFIFYTFDLFTNWISQLGWFKKYK